MAVARVDPSKVGERAVGFALAPRLNAAGRLYRADAGLELMLTEDSLRAAQIAQELDRANQERRHTETRILFEAEAQVAALGESPAYVLAGEGWHAGVIGIVASRLAELHHRPVVMIALEGDPARGSGRSVEGFDLLGWPDRRAAEHLGRHGGHRAAAGLEIERARSMAVRAAFARRTRRAVRGEEPLCAASAWMRCSKAASWAWRWPRSSQQLAPFGRANPSVSLLVRGAMLSDASDGRRQAPALHRAGRRCARRRGCLRQRRAPAGGRGQPADATFTLEVNEWKGVCRAASGAAPRPTLPAGGHICRRRTRARPPTLKEWPLPRIDRVPQQAHQQLELASSP